MKKDKRTEEMRLATAKEMQLIDRKAIRSFGIPSMALMERAGLAVVERATEYFDAPKALVIAGPGNNGGDGVMVARELLNRGRKASVLLTSRQENLSPDCRAQLKAAREFGVPVRFGYTPTAQELHGAVIVDAIFGTGLTKNIKGAIAGTINAINSSGCPVVSVDMPSGVSADTGQALGGAVQADITVTFGAAKRGHLLHPGAALTGELFVHDIGFPRELISTIKCIGPSAAEMALLLPEREPGSHKGDHGHLLVLAGSKGKTGAAFMAAEAALRAGAGLVTLGAPEALFDIYQARATEAMTLSLPSTKDGAFSSAALEETLSFCSSSATAIAIGPGLGMDKDTVKLVREIVRLSPVPAILDADAINALGPGAAGILGRSHSPVVLTPHPGEFARISGMSAKKTLEDRPAAALRFAKKSGACLALKGAPTIIASPEGEIFINTTGGPALAKAGSGDVLTGMTGGLIATGMVPLEAAVLGAYLHGLGGDIAAEELGEHSVTASDVIGRIPQTFMSIGG